MQAHILIQLKNGVLDPEAKAVENALKSLNFDGIRSLTMSKKVTITFGHNDKQKALQDATKMAQDLLANLVIEDFEIQIQE